MSEKFSQLFNNDSQSTMYNSRQDYSEDIVKEIIHFWLKFNSDVTIEKGLSIVDIGCGTGQLTSFLIPYAKLLIGLDSSESQIKQAKLRISDKNFPNYITLDDDAVAIENAKFIFQNDNLVFDLNIINRQFKHVSMTITLLEESRIHLTNFVKLVHSLQDALYNCSNTDFSLVGSCYEVPVPNESLDLVTAALCIHWFDIDKFYLEVDRCLKSKGALAILTFGSGYVIGQGDYQGVDFTELNKFINQDLWFGDEYFSEYLSAESRWCLNMLSGLKFLYPETGTRNETQKLEYKTTVTKYGNFLRSTSLYQSWKKNHKNEKDIVEIICDKMLFYFGYPKDGMELEFLISYPLTIILCSKP